MSNEHRPVPLHIDPVTKELYYLEWVEEFSPEKRFIKLEVPPPTIPTTVVIKDENH